LRNRSDSALVTEMARSPAGKGIRLPYAHAGNVKLYYESLGEGTPLILHAHHHRKYLPFQAPYFAQFYRTIVFDRRGAGRSDDPPGPWSTADLARDIRGLMDAHGIEQAIVGGISLGGVVSAQFGLDHPDRALGLVVGHTVPYLWPLGEEWLRQQIAALEGKGPIIVNQPRSYDWEDEGPPTTSPDFAHTMAGRFVATLDASLGTPASLPKMLNVLAAWDQRPRYPEMARLDIPVLVIVGGNEPQKTLELSHEWSLQFKRGELVVLPNTYHNAGNENPVGWNAAVHGFLQRNGL
jgi:pimeloyl-ACP methyl ester carboxylesterase